RAEPPLAREEVQKALARERGDRLVDRARHQVDRWNSFACSGRRMRNHNTLCGPSVRRYGNSPIGGKQLLLQSSSGTNPWNSRSSSSTNCAKRERLLTHIMVSS